MLNGSKKQFFNLIESFDCQDRAIRNLGTFSTTQMHPESLEKFKEYACVNAVDSIAYPELGEMTQICSNELLQLFQAQKGNTYHCYPTSGSSEAIFLAMRVLKNHWLLQNKSTATTPNIILSEQGHVAFVSAAKALGIETKILEHSKEGDWSLDALNNVLSHETIGVITTLGTPTTLKFDDIEIINKVLQRYHKQTGNFIPIHVDAASGGFITPFSKPDLLWDFRLEHVKSINVSSHKFGLVFPSLGWLCVDNALYDERLLSKNTYLGRELKRLPLQFSHSASHIVAQCFNFNFLGYDGYQKITNELYQTTNQLVDFFKRLDNIQILTPNHKTAIPGIVFIADKRVIDSLTAGLKANGWHLPTYRLKSTEGRDEASFAARIVVRYGMTNELLTELTDKMSEYLS